MVKFDLRHKFILEDSDARGQDCVLMQGKMSGRLLVPEA